MNENLPLKVLAIKDWVAHATDKLKCAMIDSARLDSEIIVAHILNKPRTYIHAHDDEPLSTEDLALANNLLALRSNRVPIAYIVGHKEFYGRQFKVTPDVLIPRPESENIINILKDIMSTETFAQQNLVDVGTGSGCLGITAKLEFPQLDVTLVDISPQALKIAQKNAEALGAIVTMKQNNLLSGYPPTVDIIIANLPYVDPEWQCSPETKHEPALALFTEDEGLGLIKELLIQAGDTLGSDGTIILEADLRQHNAIIQFATTNNYKHITTQGLILAFKKP